MRKVLFELSAKSLENAGPASGKEFLENYKKYLHRENARPILRADRQKGRLKTLDHRRPLTLK